VQKGSRSQADKNIVTQLKSQKQISEKKLVCEIQGCTARRVCIKAFCILYVKG